MKTALDWLLLNVCISGVSTNTGMNIDEIISKAKQMEKEQMADAFYAPANESEPNNFDEYYEQKYEDEK